MLTGDYDTVDRTELNPMDWDDHQDPSLEAVTRTVDLHTKSWYNEKLRQLQSRKGRLTYEKMKLDEEGPVEFVKHKGMGSSRKQRVVKRKKRNLEVEKSEEHQESSTKRQKEAPSR